ncbi:hypothetical protein ABZZ47_35425 [Streptomyces sp. NPDC006465]|uniref:hypothetical protein n=1 Tax=Streptomyces sp. NPDC006465 TaxID=3157174 RepID=UPI0033A8929A
MNARLTDPRTRQAIALNLLNWSSPVVACRSDLGHGYPHALASGTTFAGRLDGSAASLSAEGTSIDGQVAFRFEFDGTASCPPPRGQPGRGRRNARRGNARRADRETPDDNTGSIGRLERADRLVGRSRRVRVRRSDRSRVRRWWRPSPTAPAPRAAGRGGAPAGVTPTACPSRAAPRDPTRPPGLPVFTPETPPPSRDSAQDRQRGARTFRTLDVTAADALSGTRDQAQDVGDRLRGARWTLHDDGTLTAYRAGVPLLRTTSVGATTRLLTGQRTERTDVSVTTTWMEARLVGGAGRTARLDLVRAATRDMRAVVDCREFTSTSSTAQRLSLTLGRE